MATLSPPGIPLSTLNPKYLHSNSTSHTWPFSAIAELIDNAYDPDVSAKQFWIDKTMIKEQDCLTFMDNGNGMDYETMHKMLSFGYCDKMAKSGKAPIGMYGNGFKSGSMRLGKDAIVFSKSKTVRCVGMLSQTYLEEIQAQQLIVPIVCFEKSGINKFTVSDEHKASLQAILDYSPFRTQEELLAEIEAITSSGRNTGTRIIIWNLRRSSSGPLELDFQTDPYDIRLPQDVYEDTSDKSKTPVGKSHVPDIVYSLRAYCRILYLKPRMQIIVRGQNVKSELMAKSLAHTRKDNYSPKYLKKSVSITFGYNTKSKEQYGVMLYHKNRLIKAYERVGCQLRDNNKGVGVIAIIECNFLEPTHNKQSFIESDKYRNTMNNLGIKLEEYWEEIRYKKKREDPNSKPVEDTIERPDQNWVQCDSCQKWRKLPDGFDLKKLQDKWYCRLNPDPQFRNCEAEEEPEDNDEQPYQKTYKQQQKGKTAKKKNDTEERTHFDQVLQDVAVNNRTLAVQCSRLRKKLFVRSADTKSVPYIPPITPTTSTSKPNEEAVSGGTPGSVLSPDLNAVCSTASKDFLPVISDVRSLAAPPQRLKRPQPDQKEETLSKKSKVVAGPKASVPETAADVNSQVANLDENKEREETRKTEIWVNMDHGVSEAAAGDPAGSNTGVRNTTTQTSIRLKEENLSQPLSDEMAEQNDSSNSMNSPLTFSLRELDKTDEEAKLDRPVRTKSQGQHINFPQQQKKTMQNQIGPSPPLPPRPPPSHGKDGSRQPRLSGGVHPSASEVEQLRRQVERLTKERDSLQERVQRLTSQPRRQEAKQTTEGELRAAFQLIVEQRTSRSDEGIDYKSLFEKAQKQVDELVKEKEALQAAAERKSREVQCREEGVDDGSMQVECLLIELDDCRSKRDEVLTECEQLRLKLKQAQDAREGNAQNEACASQLAGPSNAEMSPESSLESLRALRQNVARLLVNHVTALELDQVNYDCNVIDEILEQYLENQDI